MMQKKNNGEVVFAESDIPNVKQGSMINKHEMPGESLTLPKM
jgi:hypothetical protein